MTLKFDLPEGFFLYDGSGIPVSPSTPVWVILRGEPAFYPGASGPAGRFLWGWDGEAGSDDDIVAYAVATNYYVLWGEEW